MMVDFKNTLVLDIMITQVRTVKPESSLESAVQIMRSEGLSCLIVDLEDSSRGFGILTQKDVIALLFDESIDAGSTQVEEVMSHPCLALPPQWNLETAVDSMRMIGVRRAPVVDGGKLVGTLSFTDVFMYASADESST